MRRDNSSPKKNKKYDPLLIKTVCTYFECSKLQTREYLELMGKEELKQILTMYGIDKKQIKRLVK